MALLHIARMCRWSTVRRCPQNLRNSCGAAGSRSASSTSYRGLQIPYSLPNEQAESNVGPANTDALDQFTIVGPNPRQNLRSVFVKQKTTSLGGNSSIPDEGPLHGYDPTHGVPEDLTNDDVFIDSADDTLKVLEKRKAVPVSGRWLRDMCACKDCRNPETAQKQINVLTRDAASKTRIIGVSRVSSSTPRTPPIDEPAFNIEFADGHRTTVTSANIINRFRNSAMTADRYGEVRVKTWRANVADHAPSVPYESVQAGHGMATLLKNIRKWGFCFVENTPATPEATESLLNSIGPIRNTHYGGFYDFTSDLSSRDTAYTSEALEPHTDNTYFTDPAGLQALHLLSHTSGVATGNATLNWEDGLGGESCLVDGFGAAHRLWKQNPVAYELLSKVNVLAHASGNDGITIQPAKLFPTLTHRGNPARITQVRWNTADRAGVDISWRKLDRWYDAAARFNAIVNHPSSQFWFQLKPGKLLIFDNWRVLHGRAAFTGKRRMCGGYINRDDFISKFRNTNLSREAITASTIAG